MNSISGDRETASCLLREDVAELIDHNDRRRPEQKEQYELMAAFVARMCVAGSGKRTLSWPSVRDRGYPGLVEAAYAVIGKISCNVSLLACTDVELYMLRVTCVVMLSIALFLVCHVPEATGRV